MCELGEFYDYIEGIREPALAMMRTAELCKKARTKTVESKMSWVRQRQDTRKRSYSNYRREYFSPPRFESEADKVKNWPATFKKISRQVAIKLGLAALSRESCIAGGVRHPRQPVLIAKHY